ncbi:ATP-binding protein [Poseidonocella sp. HB161398]|uniref:sensor histidine kinase n=1 Tax=Poseidonocella sp. HB161398 TaxID=2320855 RepID=UPI001108BA1D|nr:ATP-binding protein [Poseidonocella sp. HB161398]
MTAARDALAGDYATALGAYAAQGEETDLIAAFQLARAGMALGISLTEICEIHQAAAAALADATAQRRAEAFLLETLTVYDMALRGHLDTNRQLSQEVEERQRVEEDLRRASFALARQRDNLEAEVQKRTEQVVAVLDEQHRSNFALRLQNREQAEFALALAEELAGPADALVQGLRNLEAELGPELSAAARKLCDRQAAALSRLQQLADDLHAHSATVDAAPEMATVPLGPLVASVLDDLQAEGEATVTPLPDIRGDEIQLRILFRHLAGNALKNSGPGQSPSVEISCSAHDGKFAAITLRGHGTRLSGGQEESAQGRFPAIHPPARHAGTGLGLAICRCILARHGGTLRLDPAEGGGTSARLTLPRASTRR